MFVLFDENKTKAVAVIGDVSKNQQHLAFELPEGAGTDPRRYGIASGQLVDLYEGKTDKEVDQLFIDVAVVNAPVQVTAVNKPQPITKLEFMNRFTLEELEAIYIAARTSVLVEVFLDKMKMAEFIDITDSNTIAGVNSLSNAGLIATERAEVILS